METVDVQEKPTRDTAIPKKIQERVAARQNENIHKRLYDDAEKNKEKHERTGEDANIEREPEEYTFTPKINDPLPPREERQEPLSYTQPAARNGASPKKKASP